MGEHLENILNRMPHWWKKSVNSRLTQILLAVETELDAFDVEKALLIRSIQIDTAELEELDHIGALFKLPRKAGESDTDYRARIKIARVSFLGSGTVDGITNAFVGATGLPSSQISISDVFDLKFLATLTFTSPAELTLLPDAVEAVWEAKAAGIYPLFAFELDFGESIETAELREIIPLSTFDEFIIEVSLIEGTDVIS